MGWRGAWTPVAAVAMVLAFSSMAIAKGYGIYFENGYHEVGTTTTAFAVVEFDSRHGASRAFRLQNFYAYLRLGDNDRTLVRLGRVKLGPWDHTGTELDARVKFRISSGAEGHYRVVICRLGCAHLPKAPHPTSIRIVSGPFDARLNVSIDRLVARVGTEIERRDFHTRPWSGSLRQRIIYDARIEDSERAETIQDI